MAEKTQSAGIANSLTGDTLHDILRKIIYIFMIFSSAISSAQESISESSKNHNYDQIINHTPKGLVTDTMFIKKNRFLYDNSKSIAGLRICYEYQKYLKFDRSDIDFLEQQINQISVAFYLENNPILIRTVGGYEGCPDKMTFLDNLNGKSITIVNFCFSCPGYPKEIEKFISVFNNRTKQLLSNN